MTNNFDHMIQGYTSDEMNTWPSDSYAGRERDLADLLTDDTLEAIDAALDADEFAAYTIFMLLMMNEAAFLTLTNPPLNEDDRLYLRALIQDDARDDSSEPFQARVAQRITARNTLIKLASGFPHTDIS